MKQVIVIGGRGNGTVAMSSIEQSLNPSLWAIKGWLNDAMPEGSILNGYPTLGKVLEAQRFNDADTYFVYTLLSPKKAIERYHLLEQINIPFHKYATFTHPTAVVGHGCRIGWGVMIEPFALLAPDVTIGNHSIVRSAAIGHDSEIGCCSMVCIQAAIGSYVHGGRGVHFGMGCVIREHTNIGDWAIIGQGAVVLNHVAPYSIVAGNPAREIGVVPHEVN